MLMDPIFLHTGGLEQRIRLTLAAAWDDLAVGTVLWLCRRDGVLELTIPVATIGWLRRAFCFTEEDTEHITTLEWGRVRLQGLLLRALPLQADDIAHAAHQQPSRAASSDGAMERTAYVTVIDARTVTSRRAQCATRRILLSQCPLSAPAPIIPLTHRPPRRTRYCATAVPAGHAADGTNELQAPPPRVVVTPFLSTTVPEVWMYDHAEFQIDELSPSPIRYIFQPDSDHGWSLLELNDPVQSVDEHARVRSLVDGLNLAFGGHAHIAGQLDSAEDGRIIGWQMHSVHMAVRRAPWPLFRMAHAGWDEAESPDSSDDEDAELPFRTPPVLDEAALQRFVDRWFRNPGELNLRAISAMMQSSHGETLISAVTALRAAIHFTAGEDASRFSTLKAAMETVGARVEDGEEKVWDFGEACARGETLADVHHERWRTKMLRYRTFTHRVVLALSGLSPSYIDYTTAFFFDQPLSFSPPYAW